ncbi:MAG: YchJ family metal-binding protein [Mariprofundus sp.]|nr:YchJ family metal-binding protein [Mariprofundus sp.]
MHHNRLCPCSSGNRYAACCEPIIEGAAAASAEALMRSRYSAYVLGHWNYLHTSWHPDTRPSKVSPTSTDWLGLTIIHATENTVEFIAGFRQNGNIMALHETSRFAQVDGHWHYLDGDCDVCEAGRNTPCPCGSGLKTKRCCSNAAFVSTSRHADWQAAIAVKRD